MTTTRAPFRTRSMIFGSEARSSFASMVIVMGRVLRRLSNSQYLRRLRTARDRPPHLPHQRRRLAHQLLVGRCPLPRVILQPDAEVTAALQSEPRDAGSHHVAAD